MKLNNGTMLRAGGMGMPPAMMAAAGAVLVMTAVGVLMYLRREARATDGAVRRRGRSRSRARLRLIHGNGEVPASEPETDPDMPERDSGRAA